MRRTITWMMVATLTASLVSGAPAALPPDGISRGRLVRLQRTIKRKTKRPKKFRARIFGACAGTSIVTATDELGNRLFPTSLVPVTTDSFVFTTREPRFLQSPVQQVRILLLGEDPPMATVANTGVGRLVFDDAGIGSFVGSDGHALISCAIAGGCSVLRDLGRPIVDLAAAGSGTFVVVSQNSIGNAETVFVAADGTQTTLMTVQDALGFYPRSVAVHGGTAFVGGIRDFGTGTLTAVVMSVPLAGGQTGEVVELGQADEDHLLTFDLTTQDRAVRFPQAMAFLGDDLVVASESLLPYLENDGTPESSHLVRIHLDATGIAQSTEEIPLDVPDGFVGAIDLASLDGQLFVVDSGVRDRFNGFSGQTGDPIFSGRILRVCPR